MISTNDYRDFGRTFLDEILEWIADKIAPEDVFSEEQLADWAEGNGFVPEGELDE